MPPKKPTAEQLRKANIRVIDRSGALQRVAPADGLKDTIVRYLPPAGPYYDQSVLGASTEMSKKGEKCVFCWNAKAGSKKCNCKNKCVLCDTKEHRGFECPKLYASMRWWHKRQHHPRPKARVRPNPAERAYLVIAGVLKDWKVLDEPVNVNMNSSGEGTLRRQEGAAGLDELAQCTAVSVNNCNSPITCNPSGLPT